MSSTNALIQDVHSQFVRDPRYGPVSEALLDAVCSAVSADGAVLVFFRNALKWQMDRSCITSRGTAAHAEYRQRLLKLLERISAGPGALEWIDSLMEKDMRQMSPAVLPQGTRAFAIYKVVRRKMVVGFVLTYRVNSSQTIAGDETLALEVLIQEFLCILDRLEFAEFCEQSQHKALLVGCSTVLRRAENIAVRFASSNCPVLITGESGTGKEVMARLIHFHSVRRHKPFVAVNCGAFSSDHLLASELFGHTRGSFTGAVSAKRGKFEMAEGGTLFLDEVASMSPAMQISLLRTLRYREIQKVGDDAVLRTVDTRVLAACNEDLGEMVRSGRFRQDLHSRLQVATLQIPSLRERREDIPLLIEFLLQRIGSTVCGAAKTVDEDVITLLQKAYWEDNIAGLENCLNHAYLVSENRISLEHLPETFFSHQRSVSNRPVECMNPKPAPLPDQASLRIAMSQFERQYIRNCLFRHEGNISQTAKALGLSRQGLQKKLRCYRDAPKDSAA